MALKSSGMSIGFSIYIVDLDGAVYFDREKNCDVRQAKESKKSLLASNSNEIQSILIV